jgi:hypothetical protein
MDTSKIICIVSLCQRDTEIVRFEKFFNKIKERNLSSYEMSSFDDPDGDYIHFIFHIGTLEGNLADIVNYIYENEHNKLW